MRINFFALLMLMEILLISCNQKTNIVLPITFKSSEKEQLKRRDELVKDGVLRFSINDNGDTSYYRDLMVNSSPYETLFKVNYDHLGFGGPLRCYAYALSVVPYSKSGNDTDKVPKWNLENPVCLTSTFTTIKSYLDQEYGKPTLITNNYDVLLNKDDTSFKYSLDTADIYLTHSPTVTNEYYNVDFKFPFFQRAYITITSKSYFKDADNETKRRISLLSPEDVLEITFYNAKLKDALDSNGYARIDLLANYENFKTVLIDADIIEAKGVLACTDMYNDTLVSQEISYKFSPPLVRRGKIGLSREYSMQSFSLNPFGDAYSKIYNELRQNRKVKVSFEPYAIVFNDGTVIK